MATEHRLLSVCVLVALAIATPGVAQHRHETPTSGVNKLVRTPLPHWQVGDVDRELSRLCSMGQFNQRTMYRYSAHFSGNSGASLVGGAKGNGFNLRDPLTRANPDFDYWFYRDGTANCIVFRAAVDGRGVRPDGPLPVNPPFRPTR